MAYTHRLQPWHSQCPRECKATGKGSVASQTQRTLPALLSGLYLSLSPQGLVSAKGIDKLISCLFSHICSPVTSDLQSYQCLLPGILYLLMPGAFIGWDL